MGKTFCHRVLVPLAVVTVTAAGLAVSAQPAAAAVGCSAGYAVTSQWQGGFQGAVSVTNLGDPLDGWTLTFVFADAAQRVSQGWNATWGQSGGTVTAASMSWNGVVATNSSVTLGFIGAWSGSNPAPSGFAVNGVACTGSTGTGTTATTTRTTTSTRSTTTIPTTTTRPTTTTTTRPTTTTTSTGSGDAWNPPSNLVAPLASVWSHQESTYGNLYGFRNYAWDQVMANRGSLNYCVRWDSSAPVTAAQRDQVHAALARQVKHWTDQLVENGRGWNSWPYPEVPVKVVGWAVRDRNTLQWTDNSVDIYVNDIRENAPQCSTACGRFFHQDGNYSSCPGGAARHYDMSLWLTAGMGGGAGGDWGQRVGSEYFMGAINQDNIHIVEHELGHSFGLDDFYDWSPISSGFIMKAGSATQVTEFDKWMYRDWWRHLKSRYGY